MWASDTCLSVAWMDINSVHRDQRIFYPKGLTSGSDLYNMGRDKKC